MVQMSLHVEHEHNPLLNGLVVYSSCQILPHLFISMLSKRLNVRLILNYTTSRGQRRERFIYIYIYILVKTREM